MKDLSDKNKAILTDILPKFNAIPGPRVGDFYIDEKGFYYRITHDWGPAMQCQCLEFNGSFYLGHPRATYSGDLSPVIVKTKLQLTDEVKEGQFWFFSEGRVMDHNGVYFMIPVRVYKLIDKE